MLSFKFLRLRTILRGIAVNTIFLCKGQGFSLNVEGCKGAQKSFVVGATYYEQEMTVIMHADNMVFIVKTCTVRVLFLYSVFRMADIMDCIVIVDKVSGPRVSILTVIS